MLARFEQLMEQAVEGSLRRIFPTTLQPVQLAKAAARAMEEGRVVGLRGAEVPNHYTLRIAEADAARLGSYAQTLSSELADYLVQYARERRLRPIAAPVVELVADSHTRPGTVRAEAKFDDVGVERRAEVETAIGNTRQLRLAQLASATGEQAIATPDETTWWLIGEGELRYALQPDSMLVRVGRAADNDLVIGNQRVSRYHAQLRRVGTTWLVYDLESTNGTFVDDQRVDQGQPRKLAATSTVRLGDYELRASPDQQGARGCD